MPNLNDLTALALPTGSRLVADETENRLSLSLDEQLLITLQLTREPELQVRVEARVDTQAVWAAGYWLFARDPACQRLTWHLDEAPAEALLSGLLVPNGLAGQYRCERTLFWQLPQPWLGTSLTSSYPQQMVISGGKRHPLRPVKPRGEVYRRFDARLGAWISLRTLDIDLDLARFNRWQNSARVASFWQEEGSLEQHREYLSKLDADPHTVTLIGCFDDQPFAYFEAYWAKEDRIAPFYDVDDYVSPPHVQSE